MPVSVRSAEEQGDVQQPRLGDLRRPAGGHRGPGRAARFGRTSRWSTSSSSHEAVAGDVLVGLSGFAPAMLLALGAAGRDARAAAQRQHRDHERPRAPAAALCGGPADARVLPVRAARRPRARGRRDLLLRRRPGLRRHGRLRPGARHRRALRGASSARWPSWSRPPSAAASRSRAAPRPAPDLRGPYATRRGAEGGVGAVRRPPRGRRRPRRLTGRRRGRHTARCPGRGHQQRPAVRRLEPLPPPVRLAGQGPRDRRRIPGVPVARRALRRRNRRDGARSRRGRSGRWRAPSRRPPGPDP